MIYTWGGYPPFLLPCMKPWLLYTLTHYVTCTITDTTDVQFTEVVFFENRLFLRCSFADNSQARGCIIRFTLSSTNETESFDVRRKSGFMCTNANNQREAYNSVVVLDREAGGMEGNVTLNITQSVVNVTSLEQYIELTGCRDGEREGVREILLSWFYFSYST